MGKTTPMEMVSSATGLALPLAQRTAAMRRVKASRCRVRSRKELIMVLLGRTVHDIAASSRYTRGYPSHIWRCGLRLGAPAAPARNPTFHKSVKGGAPHL